MNIVKYIFPFICRMVVCVTMMTFVSSLSGCAGGKHGWETRDYQSLGWLQVNPDETEKRTGYKRLQNEMEYSDPVKAFVQSKGLPDYLRVPKTNVFSDRLLLAYSREGKVYELNSSPFGGVIGIHDWFDFQLPMNIRKTFQNSGIMADNQQAITSLNVSSVFNDAVNTEKDTKQTFTSSHVNEKRLALIIGNSKYRYGGSLTNPVNDARSMKRALKSLGFTVIKYEDSTQKEMKRAMDDFGRKLKDYSVALFFYAGHGVQVKGNNYLIPVNAKLENENDVEYDTVRADRVLAKMESAGSKTNIVLLDACRDNPFERSWRRGTKGTGLAFMNAPSGSIIAYATSPGSTASDGTGSNGLYTSAILQHIKTSNITIEQMFKRVRSMIMERSDNKQIPWESTSLRGNFYFKRE